MNWGACEQYVQSVSLQAGDCDFLFARALVHFDNHPLQTGLNPLNQQNVIQSLWRHADNMIWNVSYMNEFSFYGNALSTVNLFGADLLLE